MGEDGGDEGGFLPILYGDGCPIIGWKGIYSHLSQPYPSMTNPLKNERPAYRSRLANVFKKIIQYFKF